MRDRACTILEAAIGNLDRSIEIYFSQQETEEKTKVLEISSDHEDEDLEMERIVTDNYDVIFKIMINDQYTKALTHSPSVIQTLYSQVG